MIKNYKQFNEGIKSLLVGPSEEEIWNNIKDLSPEALLIKSCKSGLLIGVKFAIEKGVNIHIAEDIPLRITSKNNNYDIVEYLLTNYKFPDYILKLVYDSYAIGDSMTLIGKYLYKKSSIQ